MSAPTSHRNCTGLPRGAPSRYSGGGGWEACAYQLVTELIYSWSTTILRAFAPSQTC
jgi:hypothetical protein